MLNFHFILNDDNKLTLSSSPAPENKKSDSLKVNIIGDYMKEQRLKKNLTKLDVARKLGFKNITKTVIHITEIEENSKSFLGYNEKLIEIYSASDKDLKIAKLDQEKILLELKEKEKQEYRKLSKVKTNFYLSVIENLPFLYSKYEEIMNTDKYYFCPAFDSYFGTAYISIGRFELYIGELLQLWKDNKWKNECPQCRGTVYITNAGGSPLSGAGSGWGTCEGCKTNIYGITPFRKFFHEIRELPRREIPEDLEFISFETMLADLEK